MYAKIRSCDDWESKAVQYASSLNVALLLNCGDSVTGVSVSPGKTSSAGQFSRPSLGATIKRTGLRSRASLGNHNKASKKTAYGYVKTSQPGNSLTERNIDRENPFFFGRLALY